MHALLNRAVTLEKHDGIVFVRRKTMRSIAMHVVAGSFAVDASHKARRNLSTFLDEYFIPVVTCSNMSTPLDLKRGLLPCSNMPIKMAMPCTQLSRWGKYSDSKASVAAAKSSRALCTSSRYCSGTSPGISGERFSSTPTSVLARRSMFFSPQYGYGNGFSAFPFFSHTLRRSSSSVLRNAS